MKKVLAVVVSIFWLVLIVGIPALVLTGNAAQLIPASLQEQLAQLGGQDLISMLGLTTDPSSSVNEPIVVVETVTPAPEVAATATPTDLPSPTPEPPATATPLPVPTEEPTPDTPALPSVAFPVAVRGQAELRTGPGLEFDSVGLVDAGATILISAQDESGEWFQLENGNWIASEALTSKPPVPIVLAGQDVTPAATPETPVAAVVITPAAPATPVVVRVNGDANLRSGPGSTFDRVGGAGFGTNVNVVGKFATDNWYLLDSGSWIFGELLESAPDVPQVNADGTPVGGAAPALSATTPITPSTVITPSTAITATPTANTIANLRAAPNTSAAIIGTAQPGQALVVVGKNGAGDWLKLDTGSWIFAELVDNAPANLPVVSEDAAAVSGNSANPTQPAATTPITQTATTPITQTVATETPVTGAPATVTPAASSAAVDANLRSGPGTTFDLVGSITAGTALKIVGRNEVGDWLKLDSGVWIFGELVANAPADLPVVTQ